MLAQPFFRNDAHAWALHSGEACMFDDVAGREAFVREGYPPFEPYDDKGYRSHELVEELRGLIQTFDNVGGYDLDEAEVLVANLLVLADLANAGAAHIRKTIDHERAIEAELDRRWNERVIDGLRQIAAETAA